MRYKHKREPLTQDEMTRIARVCEGTREKLIVWTLIDTGLRVEELCNLTKDSIDWSRHAIEVYGKNTLGGPRKKRTVNLTDRCRPLLEGHFAVNDTIGITTRTANRIVHRAAKKADIRRLCSPHVLRHSFAVTALRRGVSLPALQKILGHEDLSTTKIYLNLQMDEALKEVQEKW
jgi:integrase/recombinase XerD